MNIYTENRKINVWSMMKTEIREESFGYRYIHLSTDLNRLEIGRSRERDSDKEKETAQDRDRRYFLQIDSKPSTSLSTSNFNSLFDPFVYPSSYLPLPFLLPPPILSHTPALD